MSREQRTAHSPASLTPYYTAHFPELLLSDNEHHFCKAYARQAPFQALDTCLLLSSYNSPMSWCCFHTQSIDARSETRSHEGL